MNLGGPSETTCNKNRTAFTVKPVYSGHAI